jgi:hypothetical protein
MENINETPIKRALLLMKYDNSKTLTENIKSQRLLNEGLAYNSVANILSKCGAMKNDGGNLDEALISQIQVDFQSAFGSWIGTDLDKMRTALSNLERANYVDLCNVSKLYKQRTNNEFLEDIDSDIDREPEWNEINSVFTKASMNKLGAVDSVKGKFPCATGTPTADGKFLTIKGSNDGNYNLAEDGKIYNTDNTDTGYFGVCVGNTFKIDKT